MIVPMTQLAFMIAASLAAPTTLVVLVDGKRQTRLALDELHRGVVSVQGLAPGATVTLFLVDERTGKKSGDALGEGTAGGDAELTFPGSTLARAGAACPGCASIALLAEVDGRATARVRIELGPPSAANGAPSDREIERLVADLYGNERVQWSLTRAELMAHELLPETNPKKAALATADPLAVIEATRMRELAVVRARLAGRSPSSVDEACFTGSILRSLKLLGTTTVSRDTFSEQLRAERDLEVSLHLVRDERGAIQTRDVVCRTSVELKRVIGQSGWKVTGLAYFTEPRACR